LEILILGAVIPILVFQILSFRQNLRFTTEKINQLMTGNLKQQAERVDLTIDNYVGQVYQIYSDQDISDNINILNDSNNPNKAAAFNHIYNRLRQYNLAKNNVRCVSIVCEDKTAITYDYITGSSLDTLWNGFPDMTATEAYLNAKDTAGIAITPTQSITEKNGETYVFHLSKRLYDLENLEQGSIATVIISIDSKALENICVSDFGADKLTATEITFIMDKNHRVIFFPDNIFMGVKLKEDLDPKEFIDLSGYFRGRQVALNEYEDINNGWLFYSAYDRDYIFKDAKRNQIFFLIMSVVTLLIVAILVIVLVTSIEWAVNRRKDAEIKALEAQINPHFLYNTLDSINWMAIEAGQYEISSMLRNLGVILRYSVSKSNSQVTVREVADWAEKYIGLQRVRFNNSFDYEINVAKEAEDKYIHKLIVQPFIENAIIHGFEKTKADGRLSVDIFIENENLCIIIEDNGCGMPRETVDMYNDRKRAADGEAMGIGLANVFSRILMYYQAKGSWNIVSMPGMGTAITIRLPVREKTDEDTNSRR